MSIKKDFTFVIHTFMLDIGLKKSELVVYALLYSYTRGSVGLFYGAQSTLAEQTRLSLKTISRILKTLRERKLIENVVIDEKKGIRCCEVSKKDSEGRKPIRRYEQSGYSTEHLLKVLKGELVEMPDNVENKIVRLFWGSVRMSLEQLHKLATLVSDSDLFMYMTKIMRIQGKNEKYDLGPGPRNHYKLIRKWIKEDFSI